MKIIQLNHQNKNSLSNLVGQSSTEKALYLPLDYLINFENQPFLPYQTDALKELAESIEAQGLLHFPVVREMGNEYQILSGHNRIRACRLLGWQKIPCVVKENITDEEATLIMLNSNLHQRQQLSHKEKILAYSQQHALQKQHKQLGVTAFQDDIRTVQRYVKLSNLIPEFIDRIDKKQLGLGVAYELAFLSHDDQNQVLNYIDNYDIKMSVKHIKTLRQQEKIDEEILSQVFETSLKTDKKEIVDKIVKKINIQQLPITLEVDELYQFITFLVDKKIIK